MQIFLTDSVWLKTCEHKMLVLGCGNTHVSLDFPVFQIDGQHTPTDYRLLDTVSGDALPNGGRRTFLTYECDGLVLKVELRTYPDMPVFRFRYTFYSKKLSHMTKAAGSDDICYTCMRFSEAMTFTEVQLSQFDPYYHCYTPMAFPLDAQREAIGPIIFSEGKAASLLLAYEHGAQAPDGFLKFRAGEERRTLCLRASKGNYWNGFELSQTHAFNSCFFECALVSDPLEELHQAYRRFVRCFLSDNAAARSTRIFYNTWNNQERNRNFRNLPYLHSMNEAQMLMELDIAHDIGVDVFVIDAGWFEKTGDWKPHPWRFPNGFDKIRQRAESYGMVLGAWINPVAAAHSSKAACDHPEYRLTMNGKCHELGQIWETEESVEMCLCSGYADLLAERLIELNQEYGISYFKWDAVNVQMCDSPLHNHGTRLNSSQELRDCCAYEQIRILIDIGERIAASVPDVIIDFDATEAGRCFGLGFLTVGRYFLINNGPYACDFDLPHDFRVFGQDKPVPLDPLMNIFWHPGAMRSRLCRIATRYDVLIPASAFLVHYLPDAPRLSQDNAIASMIISGQGIWGDLEALSEADRALFRDQLARYKRVTDAIDAAYPKLTGQIGSSPEIHEKLHGGRGCICFFTYLKGEFMYAVDAVPESVMIVGADRVERYGNGRCDIWVNLDNNGCRIVFFI